MVSQKLSILITVALVSMITMQGQTFRSLGLHIELESQLREDFCPRMHVEGNIIFVCTSEGLYSKDLSNEDSEWELAGFEGIPLQDYARSGNDIIALRHNVGDGFLLLSHDGGKTYEDVTPEPFKQHFYGPHMMISLIQHPNDPNTLLASSYYLGIYQSSDFGQTWNRLTGALVGPFIGYHTSWPEILYNSGETDAMEPIIYISYDGGKTWKESVPDWNGDDCIGRVAFNPINPDCWMAGGCCVIYKTTDNGQTWNTQSFSTDNDHQALWSFTAFDNKKSDIAYAVGYGETIKLMCSTDGGESWGSPLLGSSLDRINDFQQYADKLLIYADTDVFEVSKADLLATYPFVEAPITFTQGQMATIILPVAPDASKGKYYRLDRCEGSEIIFEQELQPQAQIPYIIVPGEDFSIDPSTLDLAGLNNDTVSTEGVSFIGTYSRKELNEQEGFYIDIIDTTPDCTPLPGEGQGVRLVGALRAYLQVTWNDPYNQGGTKTPPMEKLQIVLKDNGTGIEGNEESRMKDGESDAAVYDLNGRRTDSSLFSLRSSLKKSIYIVDGKKKAR